METEQGQPVWALLLADDPVPNLEIAKWNITFTNWDNRGHGIKFSLRTPHSDEGDTIEQQPIGDSDCRVAAVVNHPRSISASPRILCALFNVSNSKMAGTYNLLTWIFTEC